jgi:peptide/nickel transport system permease protein
MLAYILSRILQAIPVLLVVGFIAFAMFAYIGDPVASMLGQDYTEAQRVALVHQLGLDQPFFVQYAKFIWAALHGNFGMSYRLAQPVAGLIAQRLPATLELVATATVFSVLLGWLPSFGRGDTVQLGAWWTTGFLTISGLRALVLPAITLGLFQLTLIMRLVRAEMLEVLRTDYIKFARARGLSNRAVYFGHALKNTLVPVITIAGLQIGGIIAFSLVTETVFQWPGMGLLLVQSVAVADIPVMSAYLLLVGVVFVLINLVVDLLYFAVDPRLRVDRTIATATR